MKVVLSIAGFISIALGLVYLTGSQVVHDKHGVVALVAGIVCFLLARRSSPQSGVLPPR